MNGVEPPDSATTLKDFAFEEADNHNNHNHIMTAEDDIDPLEKDPSLRETPSLHEEKGNIDGGSLHKHPSQAKEIWKFRLRPVDDDEPEDWWFASTGIPLLAATLGPMANVFSIAALVSSWRATYTDPDLIDDTAIGYADPEWCVVLNIVSLVFGFLGNIFLLFNFTQAVRYIVALPLTIILWFLATGILTSITICISVYAPPQWPSPDYIGDTYTESFWYAVIASALYFICSVLLMVNMFGYFLGHYTQHFELDDDQRNLILQTMMFFLWLAAGAGVFARVNEWSYGDALYFCDVTILTVGFGDFFPDNDAGRGIVFPYSVGGIIILGLVVSSISRFAKQLGHDKVIKKKLERQRLETLSLTVTCSAEKDQREELERHAKKWRRNGRPEISAPFNPQQRSVAFNVPTPDVRSIQSPRTVGSAYSRSLESPSSPRTPQSWVSGFSDKIGGARLSRTLSRSTTFSLKKRPTLRRMTTRVTKLKMLRDERDRFNEMRRMQAETRQWKKWMSLITSIAAFSILWCGGALVFHLLEHDTYFESLYFCYVSLLTIGYGDLAPRSNPGKPFFVLWSLCAIPTMTILISNMGDTIIASYKRGSFKVADWTLLPKKGFMKEFLDQHPRLKSWVDERVLLHQQKERLEYGFPVGPDESEEKPQQNADKQLEQLASEEALDEHDLAQKLVAAIRETADHLKTARVLRYSYEEWVEYTRLIRFTQYTDRRLSTAELLDAEEQDEGIIEWDWIGEDSPMMADSSETEWILDRLTESLERYMRRQIPQLKRRQDEQRSRRRSNRTSGSISPSAIDQQIEETGFTPIHLMAQEGPRRRANSSQRQSSIHTERRPSLMQSRHSPAPGVPLEEPGSPDSKTVTLNNDNLPLDATQTSTTPPQISVTTNFDSQHDQSRTTSVSTASNHTDYSGIHETQHHASSSRSEGRRHTFHLKKAKPSRKHRAGSENMQSLTAMRLKRHQ